MGYKLINRSETELGGFIATITKTYLFGLISTTNEYHFCDDKTYSLPKRYRTKIYGVFNINTGKPLDYIEADDLRKFIEALDRKKEYEKTLHSK